VHSDLLAGIDFEASVEDLHLFYTLWEMIWLVFRRKHQASIVITGTDYQTAVRICLDRLSAAITALSYAGGGTTFPRGEPAMKWEPSEGLVRRHHRGLLYRQPMSDHLRPTCSTQRGQAAAVVIVEVRDQHCGDAVGLNAVGAKRLYGRSPSKVTLGERH